jgi:hypothetical protein
MSGEKGVGLKEGLEGGGLNKGRTSSSFMDPANPA